jgi:hypothetical protein
VAPQSFGVSLSAVIALLESKKISHGYQFCIVHNLAISPIKETRLLIEIIWN